MNKNIKEFLDSYNSYLLELQSNAGMEDDLKRKRKRINADDAMDASNKRNNPDVNISNTNYSDGKLPMHSKFVNDLLVYLGSHFPQPGVTRVNIKAELRKHLKGDEDELLRITKKVGDICSKERDKYLDNIGKRVSKIALEP